MRRTVTLAALIVLSMLSMSASIAGDIKVSIPFEFVVQDQTLPAGDYVVSANVLGEGTLVLAGAGGKHAVSTLPVGASTDSDERALVFHVYGDKRFLAQVRMGGGSERQVQLSKAEKNVIASNAVRSELLVQAR